MWLAKLSCHFAGVAFEQDRLAAQAASRRAEPLLCADHVIAWLQADDAEDERVVAEAVAAFEWDLRQGRLGRSCRRPRRAGGNGSTKVGWRGKPCRRQAGRALAARRNRPLRSARV
jgi:hypothetical protein